VVASAYEYLINDDQIKSDFADAYFRCLVAVWIWLAASAKTMFPPQYAPPLRRHIL
jgi:hypothetical protein